MKVRALRGVCIGVDRHLGAGDVADLEAALAAFLISIKSVEAVVVDQEPEPIESDIPEVKSKPAKSGAKEK